MTVRIGSLAKQDALMAYSSTLASELLRRAVQAVPSGRRVAWLRRELNVAHSGMGNRMVAEYKRLERVGGSDQALFDAVRLALANRVASVVADQHGMSGLGTSERDINAVFCGLIGAGTVGGTIAASFNESKGATGSASIVGRAGSDVLRSAGCDAGAIAAQASITAANLQQARLDAAEERASRERSQQFMMVAVGGGVVVVLLAGLAFVALKK